MTNKLIMDYIEEERERCAVLAAKLARGPDRDFLIHCINYAVQLSEIEERRKRFIEMTVIEDIEDLM
jgi:hypothetical protein